ncbi:RNA polymerase II-associated [Phlyctochytrium arcticum]|nr:RNA polymerase II-associated [Phlyctochytrium arcticum]
MSKNRPQELKKYGNDWAFRYVYRNDLPPLPFPPKLLAYPFPADRLYKYEQDSLLNKFYFAACGKDDELGVPCAPLAGGELAEEFLNPGVSRKPQKLDPEDQFLLAKPHADPPPGSKPTMDGTATHALSAQSPLFLRRVHVNMAGEAKTYGRSDRQVAASSSLKDQTLAPHIHLTAADKLRAIEATFAAVQKVSTESIVHPAKKPVHALEIIPIFPDLSGSWPDLVNLSVFEADPLEKPGVKKKIEPGSDKAVALDEALMKPFHNPETNETVLGYFTPSEAALAKIRQERETGISALKPDEILEYKHVRDYHYETQVNHIRQYVFRLDQDNHGVFYKRMAGRVNLKRKRAKARHEQEEEWERPTVITLSRREFSATERHQRRKICEDDLGIKDDGDDDEDAEGEQDPSFAERVRMLEGSDDDEDDLDVTGGNRGVKGKMADTTASRRDPEADMDLDREIMAQTDMALDSDSSPPP